jgi:hypothetical protein
MCHGSGLFSVLIGIAMVGLLLKLGACAFRRRRWYAYGGHGRCGGEDRGWGHRHHDHHGDRHRDRDEHGFGKRWILRSLYERLDTTPGQEKVIAQAFDEIQAAVKAAKGDWSTARSRVADAMRGNEFDHEAVGEAWAKHDNAEESMRVKIITSLQLVHDALDERQRKILADLLERGGPFGML